MNDQEAKQIFDVVLDHWIKTHKEFYDSAIKDIILYGAIQLETAVKIAESFNV